MAIGSTREELATKARSGHDQGELGGGDDEVQVVIRWAINPTTWIGQDGRDHGPLTTLAVADAL